VSKKKNKAVNFGHMGIITKITAKQKTDVIMFRSGMVKDVFTAKKNCKHLDLLF